MAANLKKRPCALVVDDQRSICESLAGVLADEGWSSETALSGYEALKVAEQQIFDLVLLDVWMEGMDGIETLQKLREQRPNLLIVIMSGHGTIETAVKSTKLGAHDYLEKPLSLEKLLPILQHASQRRLSATDKHKQAGVYELIGISDFVASVHRRIKVVAPRNSWILITGENGTGKEVVARNIHMSSPRCHRPFVAVNCAAIPEELIESELFGHTRGAFTNALADKRGRFELAHQGTLFLDEIGDMSLRTQAKILRILQEQRLERVGATEAVSVDVRVIAATNKDLHKQIAEGSFRDDLFYRLNVIPMQMIPVRERVVDIPVLIRHFADRFGAEIHRQPPTFSEEAMARLTKYAWPGNVREIKNFVERLMVLVESPSVEGYHVIDLLDRNHHDDFVIESDASLPGEPIEAQTLREARTSFEKTFIFEKLRENSWNITKTAEAIGIERSNLYRKMRSYSIETSVDKIK